MNIVTKLVVIGGLLGLVGCVSGPKPRDPDPNSSPVKPVDNQMPPPPQGRISPDDVNEWNATAKAEELYKILSAELTQSTKSMQPAER